MKNGIFDEKRFYEKQGLFKKSGVFHEKGGFSMKHGVFHDKRGLLGPVCALSGPFGPF